MLFEQFAISSSLHNTHSSPMKNLENVLYISLLGLFGLLGIWLQTEFIEEEVTTNYLNRHDPDYYIENFTATGMDETGNRAFLLQAERMAHFPDDDTALLDKPHLIEFSPERAPRHTYADSGWLSSGGDEILMTDNVKVVQEGDSRGAGGTMRTKKMRILLEKSISKDLSN